MKQATRLIITSDLHQQIGKWQELVRVVQRHAPRFVLIAGDILTKVDGFQGQRRFFGELRKYLDAIRSSGETTLLTYLGNDDYHPLEPLLDELAATGLCVNLAGKVHREDGFVFCGMNHVRDYPFGYKHWCAPDGDYVVCPVQFRGQGLTLDDQGRWVALNDLREYLLTKPSLGEQLEALRVQLSPEEVQRSIWLVHNPPAGLGMDICHHGDRVGSPQILDFIRNAQPLLGCSGHIHESPSQPGGQWAGRVGRTLWLQPGQEGSNLHHVEVVIGPDYGIRSCCHSVFGDG